MIRPGIQDLNRADPVECPREEDHLSRTCRPFAELVGASPAIRALRARLSEIIRARSRVVLLQGETGTGKTTVARLLHLHSHRRERPFVEADVVAAAEGTFESQLFGHRRGAFTGAVSPQVGWIEAAHGGTLFLDELGDLPMQLQKKLLKVLEEGRFTRLGDHCATPVDFQLVTATHQDLPEAIRAGRFREDLYYRINANTLHLPSLRERGADDIRAILEAAIEMKLGRAVPLEAAFSPEAMDFLLHDYTWPGNVRQLQRLLDVAELHNQFIDGRCVQRDQVEALLLGPRPATGSGLPPPGMTLEALNQWCREIRQRYVQREIERAGGNVSEAARRMGGLQHRTRLIQIRDGG